MFNNLDNVTRLDPFELENTSNKNPFLLSEEDQKKIEEDNLFLEKSFLIND